jgi:type 1 glutamine amidotransferase
MKKRALIVYGGWEGHHPKEVSEIVARDLRNEEFQVELSDTLDSFLDEMRLKTFDLIVPNWTMGQITGEQERSLVGAVESGVGLGGFHGGAGDAFRGSSAFQFMVGGQFVAHPDNHKDYIVHFVQKDDPIAAGLSDFLIYSEQYFMHVDPSNEVLATTNFESRSAPWINGAVMPVAWKRKHGQGRVFYSAIGHSTVEFEVPQVREFTRRGLLWAAR